MNSINRLEHIDVLKGVAIFLMVVGHFLSNNLFPITPNGNEPYAVRFIFHIIYSFHMPLLFFLSGYLFVANEPPQLPEHYIGKSVYKKTMSLMMPWLSNMVVLYALFHIFHPLWFLSSLFWITVVFVSLHYLAQRQSLALWKELLIHILVFALLFVVTHFVTKTRADYIFTFHRAMKSYPYFVAGYAFFHYEKYFKNKFNNLIFTIAALSYGWLFYLENYAISDPHELLAYPIALSAIIIVYFAFTYPQSPTTHHSVIYRQLALFGRHSLTIYLFSSIFLIDCPYVGQLLHLSYSWDSLHLTCITMQILLPLLPALVAAYCSIAVQNIFRHSKLLNLLLFGKRWW